MRGITSSDPTGSGGCEGDRCSRFSTISSGSVTELLGWPGSSRFRRGDQGGPGEGVKTHGEDQECRGDVSGDSDVLDIESVDGDDDAVRAVPGRRNGADEPGFAAVVGQLDGRARQP
jgi:hypothetical protein